MTASLAFQFSLHSAVIDPTQTFSSSVRSAISSSLSLAAAHPFVCLTGVGMLGGAAWLAKRHWAYASSWTRRSPASTHTGSRKSSALSDSVAGAAKAETDEQSRKLLSVDTTLSSPVSGSSAAQTGIASRESKPRDPIDQAVRYARLLEGIINDPSIPDQEFQTWLRSEAETVRAYSRQRPSTSRNALLMPYELVGTRGLTADALKQELLGVNEGSQEAPECILWKKRLAVRRLLNQELARGETEADTAQVETSQASSKRSKPMKRRSPVQMAWRAARKDKSMMEASRLKYLASMANRERSSTGIAPSTGLQKWWGGLSNAGTAA